MVKRGRSSKKKIAQQREDIEKQLSSGNLSSQEKERLNQELLDIENEKLELQRAEAIRRAEEKRKEEEEKKEQEKREKIRASVAEYEKHIENERRRIRIANLQRACEVEEKACLSKCRGGGFGNVETNCHKNCRSSRAVCFYKAQAAQ